MNYMGARWQTSGRTRPTQERQEVFRAVLIILQSLSRESKTFPADVTSPLSTSDGFAVIKFAAHCLPRICHLIAPRTTSRTTKAAAGMQTDSTSVSRIHRALCGSDDEYIWTGKRNWCSPITWPTTPLSNTRRQEVESGSNVLLRDGDRRAVSFETACCAFLVEFSLTALLRSTHSTRTSRTVRTFVSSKKWDRC